MTPPELRCIHALFERAAARDPDRVLPVDDSGFASQRELTIRIHRRALVLRARCGAPDAIVAVALEPAARSPQGVRPRS